MRGRGAACNCSFPFLCFLLIFNSGQIHDQPWIGPLDTRKFGKGKRAASKGRAGKTDAVICAKGAAKHPSVRQQPRESSEKAAWTSLPTAQSPESLNCWDKSASARGGRPWIHQAPHISTDDVGADDLEANFDVGTHGHVGGPGHVFSVQHVCH